MNEKISALDNLSMTIYVGGEIVGEIIHWQRTGVIESWHYNGQHSVDIALFDEQHLANAILFAKWGTQPKDFLDHAKNQNVK